MKINRRFKIYLLSIIFMIIDLIIKLVIKSNMHIFDEIVIIPNIFSIYFVENSGAAFSILQNQTILLIIISILCLIFLDSLIKKSNSRLESISISMIIGGLFGNLIDRIMYLKVIDYISILNFPVFNIADILITVGAIIFIIINIRKKDIE